VYGSQTDVDLSFLIGKEICPIAIGSYDLQFNWGNGGISVWNRLFYKPAGNAEELIWVGDRQDIEIATRTVRLLKTSITDVSWEADGTLKLTFSNGDRLEVFDNDRCEAYSFRMGKIRRS
jgi:hypothetical protein